MKKKKEQINEVDIEKMSDQEVENTLIKNRGTIIKNFNDIYKDVAVMKEEEPTDEWKAKAKEDYDNAVKDFQEAKYTIYEGPKSIELAKWLKEWNAKYNHWEKASWKGVIAFDDLMGKLIEDLEKEKEAGNEPKELTLDYAPMLFIFGSMMRPAGVGLEDAKVMEALETIVDTDLDSEEGQDETSQLTYTNILEWVGRKVDGLQAVQAKIAAYQERWSMAETGFAFDFCSNELEDFVKFIQISKETADSAKY